MFKKLFITGCLCGASFFIGCQEQPTASADQEPAPDENAQAEEKELEMYEASELALLMREMYESNLEIGRQIEAGNIPESFPDDFYTLHSAVATDGMLHDTVFYKNMAAQYITNMNRITTAANPKEAKIAYNEMIMTCAGCHQVFCQGPLAKIKRMKLPVNE